jgi:hypothetical protein
METVGWETGTLVTLSDRIRRGLGLGEGEGIVVVVGSREIGELTYLELLDTHTGARFTDTAVHYRKVEENVTATCPPAPG